MDRPYRVSINSTDYIIKIQPVLSTRNCNRWTLVVLVLYEHWYGYPIVDMILVQLQGLLVQYTT